MLLAFDEKPAALSKRTVARIRAFLKVKNVTGELKYVHYSASIKSYVAYVSIAGGAAQGHLVPEAQVEEVERSEASVSTS